MDWTQAIFIVGTLGAFILWVGNKLDTDIKAQGARIDAAMTRIDSLYNIIYEMLKENKK